MGSTRDAILANIRTTLAGIDGAGSYETVVEQVLAADVAPGDFPGSGVFLGVWPVGYSIGPSRVHWSKSVDAAHVLLVGVRAILRTSTERMDAVRSGLIADLARAIWADRHRGITDRPVDTESVEFTEEVAEISGSATLASFLAVVRVSWLADPTSP